MICIMNFNKVPLESINSLKVARMISLLVVMEIVSLLIGNVTTWMTVETIATKKVAQVAFVKKLTHKMNRYII